MRPAAELISTGAELLNGRTINGHAATLGQALNAMGLALERDTTVADDLDAISQALSSALERVDLVFVSGGLGPTCDDLTRDAVARVVGRGVVIDQAALEHVRAGCSRIGRTFNEAHARQAQVVEGAVVLLNPVGAAPAERIELDTGKVIWVLPGPPLEFKGILDTYVTPWLRQQSDLVSPYRERIYLACGLGESDAVDLFDKAGFPPAGLDLAFCASSGRLELRVASRNGDEALLQKANADVCRILHRYIYATDRREMNEVVGELLDQAGATLATAESCTGGMIGALVTDISGSSHYYKGGVVAYANEVKQTLLKVREQDLREHGAVSEPVARQMAMGVRVLLNTDYGLSVTGIAGPGGGTQEKPVGLVYIGLASRQQSWVQRCQFGRTRQTVRQWTSRMALNLLRLRLLNMEI